MIIRPAPHAATTRGFTLVELLVAMGAGLFVSFAAFVLSKNATYFFQREARISSANLAAMLGMNRLIADIQRASFLASPNIQKDPLLCGDTSNWPSGLKSLAGIYIEKDGSITAHPNDLDQSKNNGFSPDSVIIGGSFHTVEQFPIRAILPGENGGQSIYLQIDSSPMQRTLSLLSSNGDTLSNIFRTDQFVRVANAEGHHEYGVVTAMTITGTPPTTVVVQIASTPAITSKMPSTTCGFSGFGTGLLLNPISRVRYDLRSLKDHEDYGSLVAPISTEVTGDNGRTELVRVELDSENKEIDDTLELIAEYAVDLKLGLTTASSGTNPTISRYPIANPANADVYNIAGSVTGGVGKPERIRGIQIRLSTRTRAADRDTDLEVGPDGRRYRFLIDGSLAGPQYARLRTFYADVALPNQASISW